MNTQKVTRYGRKLYSLLFKRILTPQTKQEYVTPTYYRILSYFDEPEVIDVNNSKLRISQFDAGIFQGQCESESELLHRISSSVTDNDIFLDIGANIGVFALVAGQYADRTVCIEPHSGNFTRLHRNIALNRNADEFSCHNVAFGEESGFANAANGGATFRITDRASSGIRIVNGDEYIRDNNIDVPNIVKIDVEGHELNVVKGMKSTLRHSECRTAFIEVHQKVSGADGLSSSEEDELFHILDKLGFTIAGKQQKSGKESVYHIRAEK